MKKKKRKKRGSGLTGLGDKTRYELLLIMKGGSKFMAGAGGKEGESKQHAEPFFHPTQALNRPPRMSKSRES